VITRFGGADDPAVREQVSRALVNKGARLGMLGRWDDSLVAYDQVVERDGGSTAPALRERVARAI
jgi:hypothetical protein